MPSGDVIVVKSCVTLTVIKKKKKIMIMKDVEAAMDYFNPLTLSDPYMGRTAQLTSRCCILNAY
jgi:hypothetical protein